MKQGRRAVRRRLAEGVCLGGSFGSAVFLLFFCFQSEQGRQEYKELNQIVQWEKLMPVMEEERAAGREEISENGDAWEEGLRSINPDYAGWIFIPGADISYPVVKGEDDSYYLTHTFEGEYNSCGCLFMDPDTEGFDGENIIIFGHNRKDGSMLGSLKRLMEPGVGKGSGEVWICRDGKWYRGRIYAGRLLDQSEEWVYQHCFGSEEERVDYLKRITAEPAVVLGDLPEQTEQIVTLSTCYGKSQRVIIQAAVLFGTD